jgi:hypothetical protein
VDNSGARPGQYSFKKQSAIQHPTETPVFADCMWVDAWPLETDAPARNLYTGLFNVQGINRFTIGRHGGVTPASAPRNMLPGQALPGTIMMGLADGHAEAVKLQNLWNYYWHLDYKPPVVRPP